MQVEVAHWLLPRELRPEPPGGCRGWPHWGSAEFGTSRGQKGFSLSIVLNLCDMDRAVEFDAQTTRGATEVEDEGADGMLAAEFQAFEAAIAESLPEYCFGYGLVDAQVSRGGHVLAMHGILG
jgi:hypothetical protein